MADVKNIIVSIPELEPGMITAVDVIDPDTRDILFPCGTKIDDAVIESLKSFKSLTGILVLGGFTSKRVAQDLKKELNVSRSLSVMKNIFGSEDTVMTELTPEATELINSVSDELLSSVYEDDNILLKLQQLQSFDDYTYKHCLRTAVISLTIGKELSLPRKDMDEISKAALLHDIGKRRLPPELVKKTDDLTAGEQEQLKKHPQYGYFMLKRSGDYSENIMRAVLMHQERFDGSGYPRGLHGSSISFMARLVAVADIYDELTSNRYYQKSWSVSEAEEYIMGSAGKLFDYNIVTAFLRAFRPYPVGTNVILSDDRKAQVVADTGNVLRPVIKCGDTQIDLYNDFNTLTLSVKRIDTSEDKKAEDVPAEDASAGQ